MDSVDGDWLADVVIDRAVAGLDRPFTYRVPARLEPIGLGWRVVIPLGRGRAEGVVVGARPDDGQDTWRSVERVVDPFPLLPPDLVDLASWMRERWGSYWSQTLRVMVPAPVRRAAIPDPRGLYPGREPLPRARAQHRLWHLLTADPGVDATVLMARDGVARATIRTAERLGVVRRGPPPWPPLVDSRLTLSAHQQQAVTEVVGRLDGTGGPLLLEGVTGSGKTEVYLTAIRHVLAGHGQAILLVPEIALTPQMRQRFLERFPGRVAVFHSAMADGERVREWHRVRTGEAPVVLGARSAVFAPCPNLRLVIVDEEHETTYKQEEHPRYHAREVARERCRRVGGTLILGSATPALETAWEARNGAIGWVRLPHRVTGQTLPPVTVVDMREELRQGRRGMFSDVLQGLIGQRLTDGEQTILLLNRRGYARAVVCRACGAALTCPLCAVSLTVHQTEARVLCHYCEHQAPIPRICPSCGSPQIRQFGTGTEQVVEALGRLWPTARVLRADQDSLRLRGSHERLFQTFAEGGADILVGTQVVAKGLDWPRVTLVGVLAADLSLTLPDFRAAERTYDLLTQVAGRAGRGERPGRVVIQTYNPEHYSVAAAAAQDFDRFYDEEIVQRRLLGYPPFGELLLLESRDENPERAEARCRDAFRALMGQPEAFHVLGPVPAPLARLRGAYRWHMLVKAPDAATVRRAMDIVSRDVPEIACTVDPYYLM